MRVKSVSIRNYRSVGGTVRLDNITVLIGPNGSGKTSVLRALELFSDDARPVTINDFRSQKKKIRVDLVLSCAGAGKTLAPYAIRREIRLRKEYELPENPKPQDKPAHRSHVLARLNPDFDKLRGLHTKATIVAEIRSLRKQKIYSDLPDYETPKKWKLAFSRYERDFFKNHPDHTPSRQDYVEWDTEILSPRQLLKIVYVPAMRDIEQDASDGSGSHLSSLIDMAIDYARKTDSELDMAAKERTTATDRYFDLVRRKIGPQLTASLNAKSRALAEDISVMVNLSPPSDKLPPPRPSITLRESGRRTDIEHVGGGLQRIYLMALLQAISQEGGKGPAPAPGSHARLILIDEPELYQHPQRQRLMLESLDEMVKNDPTVSVVCSTHSPYFVRLKRADSLRILRRGKKRIWQATRKRLVEIMLPGRKPVEEGWRELSRWMDMTATRWATEGFFAKRVVIVEGPGDRNVLLAAASVLDLKLDRQEITIVPAGSVNNIERLVHLFREFGIPTYVVWDRDGRWDKKGDMPCKRDQRLADVAMGGTFGGSLARTAINGSFACIKSNMTEELGRELRGCAGLLANSSMYAELERKRAGDERPAGGRDAGCRQPGRDAPKRLVGEAEKKFLHDRLNVTELLEDVGRESRDRLESFTVVGIVRKIDEAGRAVSGEITRIGYNGDSNAARKVPQRADR